MKKKVLLVEDIMEFRAMLKIILSGEYEVVTARDGREALDMLYDGYRPDAIVTDLKMPEMDGYELISQVKNDDEYKKIPIIVLTHSDRNADKEKSLKKGVYTYIQKSYIPKEFQTELARSLTYVTQCAS